MSDLMLDVSQAAELKMAFRRGNWTNEQIKRLSEGDLLTQVRKVILNLSVIKDIEHWIDCDAKPFAPDKLKVEEHRPGGQWKFDLQKISFYLSESQKNGDISAGDLRKKLKNKPVLNANVLDYLLARPELIPEEWKNKRIFFWGTIYRNSADCPCVRYLSFFDGRWECDKAWVGSSVLSGGAPAIIAK